MHTPSAVSHVDMSTILNPKMDIYEKSAPIRRVKAATHKSEVSLELLLFTKTIHIFLIFGRRPCRIGGSIYLCCYLSIMAVHDFFRVCHFA